MFGSHALERLFRRYGLLEKRYSNVMAGFKETQAKLVARWKRLSRPDSSALDFVVPAVSWPGRHCRFDHRNFTLPGVANGGRKAASKRGSGSCGARRRSGDR